MQKKILSILLAIVMVVTIAPVSVFAEDDILDYLTYEINDGEVTIISCDTAISGDVTIPDTIEGYPVSVIGRYAFEFCSGITKFILPNCIKKIEYGAFAGCSKISNITIPKNVTSIEAYTFTGCKALENIIISDDVIDIGQDAFFNTAYYNDEANWDNGVLYIENRLIKAESYVTEYKIKSGTLAIADNAFSECYNLTSVEIPDSVISIGWAAFMHTSLTNITIPDSLTTINGRAFSDCSSLTNITIPENVTYIGEYAFYNCDGLTSVTIPESVATIDDGAFGFCANLEDITISNSVTNIGGYAFSGTAYYNDESNWENGVLYIGNYLIEARNDITECEIKDGTALISGHSFWESSLTSIKIPDSVTSIGSAAFMYANLTSITIPDSVTSIGVCAFCDCTRLTEITIPDSVTSIGECAFLGCESLTSITIPDSVTSIGDYAFGYNNVEDSVEYELVDGFIIYGFSGSAAEVYANENGITFLILTDEPTTDEPVTDDPTTDEPTTDEPTTDEPVTDKPVQDTSTALTPNADSNITVTDTFANLIPEMTVTDIVKSVKNENITVLSADGKKLTANSPVGTGSKVQIVDKNGKVLSEYDVVVKADVTGDGTITAEDARLALRASASLDKLEGVYATAANYNGDKELTAEDARLILRKSAGLE